MRAAWAPCEAGKRKRRCIYQVDACALCPHHLRREAGRPAVRYHPPPPGRHPPDGCMPTALPAPTPPDTPSQVSSALQPRIHQVDAVKEGCPGVPASGLGTLRGGAEEEKVHPPGGCM